MSAQIKEALAALGILQHLLRHTDEAREHAATISSALEAAQQEAEANGWVKARLSLPAEGQSVLFHHYSHAENYVELGAFLDGEFVEPNGQRHSAARIWVWKDATCPKVPTL